MHRLNTLIYAVATHRSPTCALQTVCSGHWGAKVADKLALVHGLLGKADKIIIGGLMAFTFLAAQGVAVGCTHVEDAWVDRAKSMLDTANQKVRLLPVEISRTVQRIRHNCMMDAGMLGGGGREGALSAALPNSRLQCAVESDNKPTQW